MTRTARIFPVLLACALSAGCGTAAVGAAGAAAGIAYSERGAESYVLASVADAAAATEAALRSMDIIVPQRRIEAGARETEYEVTYGDYEVSVDIERDDTAASTHIQVTARENVIDYDRDVAQRILRRILDHIEG